MYFDYKKWLIKISNPLNSKKHFKYLIVRDTISNVKKYRSFVPVKYCSRLLKDYERVVENKQYSINNVGAFLDKK